MTVDTIIPPRQIKIIENSFKVIEDDSLDVAVRFYDNLLRDYPQLKPLFAEANMAKQYQKLTENFSYVIKHINHPSLLTNAVKTMGVKNASYGVLPEHYPIFGNVLLKTLKTSFGKSWSPELEAAWTAAYTAIAYLMLEAAERASNSVAMQGRRLSYNQQPRSKPIMNTIISAEEIDIIEDSFIPIKDNSAEFTATFYEQLFEARPQMEYSLGELDLIEREKKFIESFFSVIKNIRNPNNLSKAINNVKVSYAKLGILPEHYPIVGKTLLKSLKFYLGPGWTPQVESAWTAFFDSAMKQFLQPVAKAKTQPATPPATQPTTQPKNPNPPQSSDLDTDRFDRGEEKLNQVFNTAADRFTKSLKDIAPDLSRYIIEYGFGEIYSRPGLDLKSRQIAAISALVVQGNCESQLMDNIHGALNVGCTETEVVETIVQMSMFAGFPPVLRALEVAKIVFAERD